MEHWPLQTRPTIRLLCEKGLPVSSLCVCKRGMFLKKHCNQFFISSIFLWLKEKIHKYISFFSKPVYRLSRLGGCNQYLLSGQQWHIIYLQETIPVFMYELNMPRRHHWRLHICNRSARKDWHTAVNSIQTWLGQIEEWMLPLFEQRGGGKALTGYQCSPSRPRSSRSMFWYLKGFRERG